MLSHSPTPWTVSALEQWMSTIHLEAMRGGMDRYGYSHHTCSMLLGEMEYRTEPCLPLMPPVDRTSTCTRCDVRNPGASTCHHTCCGNSRRWHVLGLVAHLAQVGVCTHRDRPMHCTYPPTC